MLVSPSCFTLSGVFSAHQFATVSMKIFRLLWSGFLCHIPHISFHNTWNCWDTCPVPHYLHLSLCEVSCLHFSVFSWMASKSLASLLLFDTLLLALHTTTLCAQIKMHSVMASWMFSNIATSLNISSVMPLSFSPPINCSVNILEYSLY